MPNPVAAIRRACLIAGVALALAVARQGPGGAGGLAQWAAVGDVGGPPLTQITPGNVDALEVAWTYHTGDVSSGTDKHGPTAFQATPLVIGNTMYLCSPFNRVIALDANRHRTLGARPAHRCLHADLSRRGVLGGARWRVLAAHPQRHARC
jgi:hypothetical protein